MQVVRHGGAGAHALQVQQHHPRVDALQLPGLTQRGPGVVLPTTLQYSTVQYNTVQYSTVQYSIVQCSAVQCSTVQCSVLGWAFLQQVRGERPRFMTISFLLSP